MTRIFHWFFIWKMDPMSGCDTPILVFTLPPRDSTLQYKRCVLLWNNYLYIIIFDKTYLGLHTFGFKQRTIYLTMRIPKLTVLFADLFNQNISKILDEINLKHANWKFENYHFTLNKFKQFLYTEARGRNNGSKSTVQIKLA